MNYVIIKNEKILQNYINEYLPDLYSGETYFIRLIARSKYVTSLRSDIDLKAFTVNNKNDIISSIKQLECEFGSYMGLGNNDIGVYLNPNPRSHELFMKNLFIKFGIMLNHGYRGHDSIELMNCELKRSCSRQIYFDLDYDKVNPYETMDKVLNLINHNCISVLPTRGGVHFLIKLEDVDTVKYPNWHENMSRVHGFDGVVSMFGDNMIPIPGCNMFGFVPEFIK